MKYTKGKWDMSTHSDNTDIIIRSQNGIIANCTIDAWPEMSKIEKEANAKLIAAAPELLESLTELFNLLEENEPQWYLRGHYNRAIKAIKKATE